MCLFLCNPFMYLFAEPCKHHSPVAYCLIFKHFFWTQTFISILLVFCLQAISISQTECHMVTHLNTFTINSHNTVYKQHSCWVSAWLPLCYDFTCYWRSKETALLRWIKAVWLWYAVSNETNIEHWNVLLTCCDRSLCETTPPKIAPHVMCQ